LSLEEAGGNSGCFVLHYITFQKSFTDSERIFHCIQPSFSSLECYTLKNAGLFKPLFWVKQYMGHI